MSTDDRTDSLLDEINASIPATAFEAEYYPGGMVKATIMLTAELAARVQMLANAEGWPEADAYVATLASGIGAFEEARARSIRDDENQAAKDEIDLLVKQMRLMEVQYAVMKMRTWNFLQAYQAATLSRGALENRANGLEALVNRLRTENEALRQEISELRAALAEDPPPISAPVPDQVVAQTPQQRLGWRRKER